MVEHSERFDLEAFDEQLRRLKQLREDEEAILGMDRTIISFPMISKEVINTLNTLGLYRGRTR